MPILRVFVRTGVNSFIHQDRSCGGRFWRRESSDQVLEAMSFQTVHIGVGMTQWNIRHQSGGGKTAADIESAFSTGLAEAILHHIVDGAAHSIIVVSVASGGLTNPSRIGRSDHVVPQAIHRVVRRSSARHAVVAIHIAVASGVGVPLAAGGASALFRRAGSPGAGRGRSQGDQNEAKRRSKQQLGPPVFVVAG